ncbi:DUF2752 domain-containing protein [Leptospira idonii]|uniref:DUF2752 domain-containing protein n=1 Tax=Leptospira idonii TaxID=1193500 RepID=UPI003CCC7BBE
MDSNYTICIPKLFFDINCFGCGITRAIWYLLHFDIAKAVEYNSLVVVVFPIIACISIKWIISKNEIYDI